MWQELNTTGGLLSVKRAAICLGVSRITLNKWKKNGTGPPYYAIGKRVYYDREDLNEYISARRVLPVGWQARKSQASIMTCPYCGLKSRVALLEEG